MVQRRGSRECRCTSPFPSPHPHRHGTQEGQVGPSDTQRSGQPVVTRTQSQELTARELPQGQYPEAEVTWSQRDTCLLGEIRIFSTAEVTLTAPPRCRSPRPLSDTTQQSELKCTKGLQIRSETTK